MSPTEDKPSALAPAIWKRAPLSWAVFKLGKALNATGYALSGVGERLMKWALPRLERKRGL